MDTASRWIFFPFLFLNKFAFPSRMEFDRFASRTNNAKIMRMFVHVSLSLSLFLFLEEIKFV